MNIIMGMCGESSRFRLIEGKPGYDIPKYMISFFGAPMFYHALNTLKVQGNVYFVVRKDHLEEFDFIEPMLSAFGKVIVIDGKTNGAAESLLMAKKHIDCLDAPMLSLNCDQYLKWDPSKFLEQVESNTDTSYIVTFKSQNPNYSYVAKNRDGSITEVREKKVISDSATAGIYHWAKTSDFMIDAEKMILENHRENNEFYVAPVYNYSIARGQKVKEFLIDNNSFFPVGTPTELSDFIKKNEKEAW